MEPPQVPESALAARPVYDAAAVDRYINELHAELEDLRAQLAAFGPGGGPPVEVEAMLGRVLINAQRTADEALTDAQRRGELVVAEAHREADRVEASAHQRAERIVDDAYRRAERIVGASSAGTPGRGFDEAAARAADLEAQRIVDEAHHRLDAIFAHTRRASDTPAPAPDEPTPEASPWDPRHSGGDPGSSPGRIVELRPDHGSPGSPSAVEAPRGEELLATGTDAHARPVPVLVALPRRDAEPVVVADGQRAPSPAVGPASLPAVRPASSPAVGRARHAAGPSPRPAKAARPFLALLRERWRVIRGGSSGFDDELLGRSAHLASLSDGSYVDQLRPGSAAPARTPGPRHFARARR